MICVLIVLSPFIFLLGGGIAMCCLYEPRERLDARGYWILTIMSVPYILMVFLSLIWREPEKPDGDDTDDA